MAFLNMLQALIGEHAPRDLEGVTATAPGRQRDQGDQIQLPGPDPQFAQQVPFNGLMGPDPGMTQQVAPPSGQDPTPPGLNYNNSRQAGALQDAMRGEPTPRGGMANPGVYGLLPQRMQHGNLRNILGALGDAFLVGSGRQQQYEPRMQRQEIGLAMAGYNPDDPNSVQAAIQRVAATGAPGSVEVADQLQKNFNDIQLRKQVMEQNNLYRQSMSSSRHDQALQRMLPYIGGMMAGVQSKDAYTSAYNRAEAIAQRIGAEYHASDFGLVDPEDWTPESTPTVGMTRNNVQVSADKGAQRATTERGQDVAANSRVQAAQIGAGSRVQSAGISAGAHVQGANIAANKATDATILSGLIEKQNAGGTLTPAEQATFNHLTQTGRSSRTLPAGLTVGGGHPVNPNTGAPMKGPSVGDVAYLKGNDSAATRARFEAHFGKGAAKKFLGY